MIEFEKSVRGERIAIELIYEDHEDNAVYIDGIGKTEVEAKQHLLTQLYEVIQELKKAQIELEKDLIDGR